MEGKVYVGSVDSYVYCLDAATGAEKWIYTTQAHVNSSPAVANGLVYVGSWDHSVYAFGILSAKTSNPIMASSTEIFYLTALVVAVVVVAIVGVLLFKRRKK